VHPLYREKVRALAEMLFEISAGRLVTSRADIQPLVGELLVCTRPSCSDEGAAAVVDRILAQADHRLGAEGIEDIITDELAIAGARHVK
jgi:hypothetical protein